MSRSGRVGELGREGPGDQRPRHPADLPRPQRAARASVRSRTGSDAGPSTARRSLGPGRARPAGLRLLGRGRDRRGDSARLLEPAQLVDDRVEPLALDELHGVEADLAVLADLEDRHDVGVVQPGRGPRLAAEPLQGLAVAGHDVPGRTLAPRGGRARPARPRRPRPCRPGRPRGGSGSRRPAAAPGRRRGGRSVGAASGGPPRPARPRPAPGRARGSRRPAPGSGRCTPAGGAARRGG